MALEHDPRTVRRQSGHLALRRAATWLTGLASVVVSAALVACAPPPASRSLPVDGAGSTDPARIEAECRLEAVGQVRRSPYYDGNRGRSFPGDYRSNVRRDLDEQYYFRDCMKRRGLE